MTAARKPIRAFAVLERDENTGGIVFARHDIVARKLGACEYSDGDIANVECRRAHWADEFADTGVVPAKLAIARNWHFECHGCGSTIDEHWLEENGLDLDGVIGSVNGRVFCCAECKQRHDDAEAKKKLVGEEFLETLRALVRRRLGDVEFAGGETWFPHVYVIEQDGAFSIGQANLHFSFPGQKIGPASLRYDWPYSFTTSGIGPVKPHFTCANGDREAFEVFAAAMKKELSLEGQ